MPSIHPTAIVDARAELAADVEVGPYCIIDGPAVIGPGTRLIGHVWLHGAVTLGRENRLYPQVAIGFEPQSLKFKPGEPAAGVAIGDRNTLRECVTIHHATDQQEPTRVGDDNFLMSTAHVGHDVQIANGCTLASSALCGGHSVLEDGVNLGGNASVHQYCRLGRMSMIGGQSAVSSDLPPFCTASGLNSVVALNIIALKRSGCEKKALEQVRWAFNTIFLKHHTNQTAIELLEEEAANNGPAAALIAEMASFVRNATRGLVPHAAVASQQRIQR